MRRSSQLSVIHHIRQSSKSNVSGVCNDEISSRSCEKIRNKTENGICQWESSRLIGRRSISQSCSPLKYYIRHFSTSPKTSPFASQNNNSSKIQNDKKSNVNFDNIPGARLPKSPIKKSARVLEITKEQADEAIKSCLELIKKRDRESYLSILSMPKNVQLEFIALNALNVELAQIRDKVDTRRGDTSAMYRLQFWKDAINSIYGMSPLPVPRQPVAIALCAFASRANPYSLSKLVETRQSTIGDRQFENIEAVAEYGRNTTGSLLSLQIDALSRTLSNKYPVIESNVYELAKQVGASYSIANLIRSTHPLLSRGIILLPKDVVELNNTSADSIYNKKKLEETRGIARDLANESRHILEKVKSKCDLIPKEFRMILATHAITVDFVLKTLEANNYDIYSPHLQRSNALLIWSLLVRKFTGKI